MHECELTRIVLRDTTEEQYIFLREKAGQKREFPIVIGRFEARAIDRRVRNLAFPRPQTHDLLAAVIDAAGVSLERVEIKKIRVVEQKGPLVTMTTTGGKKRITKPDAAKGPLEKVLERIW